MKKEKQMKHIKVIANAKLNENVVGSGCGECRSSCQSACKTSCTVGNQTCERRVKVRYAGKGNK